MTSPAYALHVATLNNDYTMKRFLVTLATAMLMLAAIPFAPLCAVAPAAPAYTHYIYMFAHANILHWAFNTWAMLVLHRLFTPLRMLTAYSSAVIISFLATDGIPFISATMPVLGFSVVLCFFIGYILLPCRRHNRTAYYQSLLFLLIGFFIPNMAASYHLMAVIVGLLYYKAEKWIRMT